MLTTLGFGSNQARVRVRAWRRPKPSYFSPSGANASTPFKSSSTRFIQPRKSSKRWMNAGIGSPLNEAGDEITNRRPRELDAGVVQDLVGIRRMQKHAESQRQRRMKNQIVHCKDER